MYLQNTPVSVQIVVETTSKLNYTENNNNYGDEREFMITIRWSMQNVLNGELSDCWVIDAKSEAMNEWFA